MATQEEYKNFKILLEYFVSHLEYVTNKDENFVGYARYIKELIEKSSFKKTGCGYKCANIQKQIFPWEKYSAGIICVNVASSPAGVYTTRLCYLNWKDTGLNVVADWNNSHIFALSLEDYHWYEEPKIHVPVEDYTHKSLESLGLFNNLAPNDELKRFFNKFEQLLIGWNKMRENEQFQKRLQPYLDLLEKSKNLVLTGAPGTGKTYLAYEIAYALTGDDKENHSHIKFCQFHPSYDYTDFVEGLRPTAPDVNGNFRFERKGWNL